MELRMLRVLMGDSAVDTVINAEDYATICTAWTNRKNSPDKFEPLDINGYAKDGLLIPLSLDAWLVTGFVLMGVQQVEVPQDKTDSVVKQATTGVIAAVRSDLSPAAAEVQSPLGIVK